MGTRRHWYALVLLVLWLSYYDHCAAPHSHCADSAGMCTALMQPPADEHSGDHDGPQPCTQLVEHDPVALGLQASALPAPATFILPAWLVAAVSPVESMQLEVRPLPPPENSSPPPLAMLTLALPVRGPSL